jgi:hypothetical protein
VIPVTWLWHDAMNHLNCSRHTLSEFLEQTDYAGRRYVNLVAPILGNLAEYQLKILKDIDGLILEDEAVI